MSFGVRRPAGGMLGALLAMGLAAGVLAADRGGSTPYWGLLSTLGGPAREHIREPFRFKRSYGRTEVRGLEYLQYREGGRPQVVGFILTNDGSRRINPAGIGGSGAFREYRFLFPDRARENVHLMVTDDVALSGKYSRDNMFREWHFFPRRFLPALELDRAGNRARVTLPTGEAIHYALDSMEIVDGVLEEQPMDMMRDRHARRNPRVHYRGDYLAITVAQRGESARRARVWGRSKLARVYYPSRYSEPCEISPGRLWDQSPKPGDSDPRLSMMYSDDQALFDLIERQCRWDLNALRRPHTRSPQPGRLASSRPGPKASPAPPGLERDRDDGDLSFGGGFVH